MTPKPDRAPERATRAVTLALSVALGAAVARPARASELDRDVRALVADLQLGEVAGLALGDHDVALALFDDAREVNPSIGARATVLEGRLVAELGAAGARHVRVVAGPSDVEVARRARALGAEWLVTVHASDRGEGRARLSAALVLVDLGLWGRTVALEAPLAIHASAVRDVVVGREPPAPRGPERPAADEAPRFAEPWTRRTSLDGRVLALAACVAPTGVAGPRSLLAVLGPAALTLFSVDGARFERVAQLDLSEEPRAREPTREPLGRLVCADDTLFVGHAGLARGFTARITRDPRGRVALERTGVLSGLPLGHEGGRLVLGVIDRGVARLGPALDVQGLGPRTLDRAMLELSFDPALPAPWRATGLSESYELQRFSGTSAETVATSGVGATLFSVAGRVYAVTTSSVAAAERDALRVVALEPRPAQVLDALEAPGAVHATAVLPTPGALELVFAAWRPSTRRTDLLSAPITGPKPRDGGPR